MAGFWDWLTAGAKSIGPGDLLGAGINIAGGLATANAQKKASKQQQETLQSAIGATTQYARPYGEVGDYAAGQLQEGLNKNALLRPFSMQDFKTDPGYQFRLGEGQKAIDRKLNAMGLSQSGPAIKAATRYNQGFASNEYGNAYNRYNQDRSNQYNMLMGGAQLGASNQPQIGNYLNQMGDARSAGTIGQATSMYGGLADAYNAIDRKQFSNMPYVTYSPYGYGAR